MTGRLAALTAIRPPGVDAGRHSRTLMWLWVLVALYWTLVPIPTIDPWLSTWLRSVDEWIIDIFRWITHAGHVVFYAIVIPIAVPVLFRLRRLFLAQGRERLAARCGWLAWVLIFLLAAIVVSGLTADIFKPLVGRARPKLLLRDDFYGAIPLTFHADYFSFPSGHANTCFAIGFTLGFLWPRLWVVWIIGATVLALSRVMVNAHFLSDCIAGSAIAVFMTLWLRAWFAHRGVLFDEDRRMISWDSPAAAALPGWSEIKRRRFWMPSRT